MVAYNQDHFKIDKKDDAMKYVILGRIFFALFFIFASNFSYSTTYAHFFQSEETIIKKSYDIVEGVVIKVVEPKKPFFAFSEPCVSPLYKLQISNSLKGRYKVGDIVSVGINRYGQSVIPGENQLAIINKASKYLYEKCWFNDMGGQFKKNDLFIPNAASVGLFNLSISSNGKKMFKAESCEDRARLMYEEFFTGLGFPVKEEKRGKLDCIVMIGPYKELYKKISDEVNKLNELK